MAGALDRLVVTRRDIADGSISMPRRLTLDGTTLGKYKQTVVRIKFPAKTGAYDTLTATPHNLGITPQLWEVVDTGIDASPGTAPGTVYTDSPKPFSRTHVAFRCTVPNTWALIALR